jgi:SAM-dependent methyltransferase
MTDWTAGYVTDVGYTHGCYRELNPLRTRVALLNAGLLPPRIETVCELGFGQGVSVNVHAAASGTPWYANDFNPEQAAFAQEMAEASGAPAHLSDEAFDAFCGRNDLPAFDYIGLHGIWSWINDTNRRIIVDFVARKLKPGGVLYISYNSLPGWAGMIPMREYLTTYGDTFGTEDQGSVGRLTDAMAFANRVSETDALFTKANPQVGERLKKLSDKDKNYLVHEFFNRNWEPMSVAAMADWLTPTKTAYGCSAHYLDHVDAVNLTKDQIALLGEINDPVFRQLTRDFMVNQQFRRDYWVKGARKLTQLEVVERLRQERVVLTTPVEDVEFKVAGARGEATLQEAIYRPILDALSDHKPKTIGQVEQTVKAQSISFQHLQQAVMVLMSHGALLPAQPEQTCRHAKKQTDRLNAHLWQRARFDGKTPYLASPVTGGGVGADRFQQLFLNARANGAKTAQEWGDFAWKVVKAQGQLVAKDGEALKTEDENVAELRERAQTFEQKRLPVLKALQVV